MQTPTDHPTIVLVHGAWADGSSWRLVIPHLLAEGLKVVGLQNPTTSLADDVAATRKVIDAIGGPVVLVGHSWGGAVITEAGNDPRVKALVYVAAFAPKAGESVGDQVGKHPSPPALSKIVDDGTGSLKISPDGWVQDVGQDLPEGDAKVLAVVQPPFPAAAFGDKVTKAAWADRACWYIVSSEDRVVSVELERSLATTMQAKTKELKAGHLSLLSKPAEVAAVIVEAANTVKQKQD